MLGANNYAIPSMLQGTLGYGWATVGRVEALGLFAAVLTWWVMERLLPRRPAPRKFLAAGFVALTAFGGLLIRIAPNASLWVDVLPALAFNSIFLLTCCLSQRCIPSAKWKRTSRYSRMRSS